MRSYWRQRNDLVQSAGRNIQRMQQDAHADEYPAG